MPTKQIEVSRETHGKVFYAAYVNNIGEKQAWNLLLEFYIKSLGAETLANIVQLGLRKGGKESADIE